MKSNITDAEFQIMDVLWQQQPLSASEIAKWLFPKTGWHRKTVNTLLSRLQQRQAVGCKKSSGINQYFSLIERSGYQREIAADVVDRVFQGQVAPLVASFVEQQTLSKDDIEGLRALLREFDDEQ